MKKSIFLFLVISVLSLLSCSKSNKNDFNYPMSTLYGTWEGTEVYIDGSWSDITSIWFEDLQFSITFYEDGTYFGDGYFGTGYGTYEASGNMIYTYVSGEPYYNYRVISLNNNKAELEMSKTNSNSTLMIRVEKK